MNKHLKIAAALLVALPTLTFAQVRTEQTFEKGWKFTREDSKDFSQQTYDDTKWQSVTVPHDWAIYGPFSIEFLHKADKDYFMEVNFRNEGLAYAATSAGANLHALYLNPNMKIKRNKIHKVYMMNYSLDFLYVKNGSLSLWIWIRDLLRTRCFININFKDLQPTIHYYKNKITSKFTTNK